MARGDLLVANSSNMLDNVPIGAAGSIFTSDGTDATWDTTALLGGNVVIGLGAAGIDYTLTFDGESNDGVLTYDEDNDIFAFGSAITATSYGGITEANLLDKTATEAVSGAYTFSGGLTVTTSAIVAGTVAADFGAVTATSYGGITEANLVDKSAAETVSGAWIFSNTTTTIGAGAAGVDYILAFDGETTDGNITYDEDNGIFAFDQDISVGANTVSCKGVVATATADDDKFFNMVTTGGTELWMEQETTGATPDWELHATTGGIKIRFFDHVNALLVYAETRFGQSGVATSPLEAAGNAASGLPVVQIQQYDDDDTFINYIGTSASDGSKSISSDTTEDAAKFGAFRVEINGVTKWVRVYDDES